jgi:hypothetical protein
VIGRHDRPAIEGFGSDRLCIDRDVEQVAAHSEHERDRPTNCQACVTRPSTGKVAAYSKAPLIAMGRLPNPATSQPASGSETINPAGKTQQHAAEGGIIEM